MFSETHRCKVRSIRDSFDAMRSLGGFLPPLIARHRYSRYSGVWQAVATCYLRTFREIGWVSILKYYA